MFRGVPLVLLWCSVGIPGCSADVPGCSVIPPPFQVVPLFRCSVFRRSWFYSMPTFYVINTIEKKDTDFDAIYVKQELN